MKCWFSYSKGFLFIYFSQKINFLSTIPFHSTCIHFWNKYSKSLTFTPTQSHSISLSFSFSERTMIRKFPLCAKNIKCLCGCVVLCITQLIDYVTATVRLHWIFASWTTFTSSNQPFHRFYIRHVFSCFSSSYSCHVNMLLLMFASCRGHSGRFQGIESSCVELLAGEFYSFY